MQQATALSLRIELRRRGWTLDSEPNRIQATKPEWPVQMYVVMHFGDEEMASVMALVIDMYPMPLAGERFRDVFNADKGELLSGLGRFRVRQLLKNGAWAPEMSDRAFLGGLNPGIRLTARLVMLDVCPTQCGDALALRFIAESGGFVETGNIIAETLSRIYLPTVLGRAVRPLELPALVPVGMPPLDQEPEPSYRWRR